MLSSRLDISLWTHLNTLEICQLFHMIGLDLDWFADCRDVVAVIAVAVVVAIVVADAG